MISKIAAVIASMCLLFGLLPEAAGENARPRPTARELAARHGGHGAGQHTTAREHSARQHAAARRRLITQQRQS